MTGLLQQVQVDLVADLLARVPLHCREKEKRGEEGVSRASPGKEGGRFKPEEKRRRFNQVLRKQKEVKVLIRGKEKVE